jgi:hypothetical protein
MCLKNVLHLWTSVVDKLPDNGTLAPKHVGVGPTYEVLYCILISAFRWFLKIWNLRYCTVWITQYQEAISMSEYSTAEILVNTCVSPSHPSLSITHTHTHTHSHKRSPTSIGFQVLQCGLVWCACTVETWKSGSYVWRNQRYKFKHIRKNDGCVVNIIRVGG